ncbi:MAG: DUF2007 domain-containing protein [Pirellulales bacterium]|nr:DUF2007 domain-containing protein [Pirellulales bacterium]
MDSDLVVIYVASSPQQAHLLRATLEQQGINAVVTNDVLEGGSGVDIVGWATQARVLVDQRDAVLARQIAMEHDRRGALLAQEHEWPETVPDQVTPSHWPCCPVCGKRRITTCTICKTTGADFLEADSQYTWGMGLPEVPGEAASPGASCGCGGGGCGGSTNEHHAKPADESCPSLGVPETQPAEADLPDDEPVALVLMCPTCDEPFVPEFARECDGCGHQFPDGCPIELPEQPVAEQNNPRVTAVLVAFVLLLGGLAAYFAVITWYSTP